MRYAAFTLAIIPLMMACRSNDKNAEGSADTSQRTAAKEIALPAPDTNATKSKFSTVIGWPQGKMPAAPSGFTVSRFAEKIESPRNIYIAPNGDILVSLANRQGNGNNILLFRDSNKDGKPDQQSTFLSGLNQPYGMLIIGSLFMLPIPMVFGDIPIKPATPRLPLQGKKILDLPAGGYNNHWTRNIIANEANSKIYISVGSGSNVAENGIENEKRRANILEVNPDGSGEIIFASGLRNPVGMAWAPGTKTLWTAVNERDGLGDDLVPDYITSVKKGAFYGWPYSYFGQHQDPRLKGQHPELVKSAIVPDIPLGAHTASLGLTFYTADKFPEKYRGGAFVGQHGSWNRSSFVGYKVTFVPFKAGAKAGEPEDFLTGFIADMDKGTVYGRPVGVAVANDGALLVADDGAGIIWRVAAK